MNGKNKVKKLMGFGAFVLCMAFAIFFTVFRTNASGETDTIKYEQRQVGAETVPTMQGYLFGGWYNEDNENTPVTNPEKGSTYYAKFVLEEVLGIKAQVSNTLLKEESTENAAIRFVTSIDSLKYKEVGFYVQKVGVDTGARKAKVTNKVYEQLYYVTGETGTAEGEQVQVKEASTLFGSGAQYFKTYTINKVPKNVYDNDIIVTPYWVTLDGTEVSGTTSIKTVNLGRSWVYVASQATEGGAYGTKDHPFTTLDKALDSVNLENGKVIMKAGGNVVVPADFTWKEKKVNDKVRTVTIAGENGATATLDFSAISKLGINDNVTFDNITLKFAGTEYSLEGRGEVYANGNELTINSNVLSINPYTFIFGGGNNTTVAKTDIKIYAGEYWRIYGGGKLGTVEGDTSVIVENTQVYGTANIKNTTRAIECGVFGGGYGDTIKGSTSVTIGKDFNKNITVKDEQCANIYGGCDRNIDKVLDNTGTTAIKGTVNNNTHVVLKENAKAEFVYGGGQLSTDVKGSCTVELQGGTLYSIWGGSKGESSNHGTNGSTTVKVSGGKVSQIIGGNGAGMTGNVYVEVSGGTIARRIYGGCYHASSTNAGHVKGYVTVVIDDNANLALNQDLDNALCVGSRYAGSVEEEVGILIFNDGLYNQYQAKIGNGISADAYDCLVKATTGGTVTADGQMLHITPDNGAMPGTITDVSNEKVTYFKGAGLFELPERDDVTSKCTVNVDFNAQNAESALNNCEARIDGIYYNKLEDAVADAKKRKDHPVITLRKDVIIEEPLTVTGKQNITLQSEEGQKYTITGTEEMKTALKALCSVSSDGVFTIQNLALSNAYQGVHSSGTLNIKNVTIDGGKGADIVNGAHGIYVDAGNVDATGIIIRNTAGMGLNVQGTGIATVSNLVVSGTNQQGIFVQGTAKVTISDFSVEDTGMVAVRLMGSANVILENTKKPISTDSYGIYISDKSTLRMTNVGVERKTSNTNTLVVVGKGATITMNGASVIDGKKASYTGRGVEVQGTFILNGGTIKNNKVNANTNGAFLPSTATNRNDGAGVYVVAGGTFTMNGGSIEGNETASAGAGVSVNGTGAAFELKGGTIQSNTANYGAVMAREGAFNMSGGFITGNTAKSDGGGVVVGGKTVDGTTIAGTFTMSGGTISNNTSTKTGGGVYMNNAAGEITLSVGSTGVITENTATTDGGGVSLTNGKFTINGGNIYKNTANAAGGGVAVNGANATFAVNGGTIQENTGKSGGAVIIRACKSFTMSGGSITGNYITGTGNGGAIYLKQLCTFTMNGGEITGNTATLGGAIFVEQKDVKNNKEAATVVFGGGVISGNKAKSTNDGGNGIGCNGTTTDVQGRLTFQNGKTIENIADSVVNMQCE